MSRMKKCSLTLCKTKTTARCLGCDRPRCGHHAKAVHETLGGIERSPKDFTQHLANLAKGFKVSCTRCRDNGTIARLTKEGLAKLR